MQSYPVYDVVLLPPGTVNQAAINLSQALAALGTIFTLGEETYYPHVSLYMANFDPAGVANTLDALQHIAKGTGPIPLTADHYDKNEFGMFEVFYQKPQAIINLQQAVVQAANPNRKGLRYMDPVGRLLADYIPTTSGEIRTNFDQYGYEEIGSYFRPHITIARMNRTSPQIDPSTLPPIQSFTDSFTTLALCAMGENGTCTYVVAKFELGVG